MAPSSNDRLPVFFLLFFVMAVGIVRAADDPAFTGSEAAQQAKMKYGHDVDQARLDYEKKIAALRQDYERKVDQSRKLYVSQLKTAQSEATKKNKLEVAVAIKGAVEALESEGTPVWPKEVLPENPSADVAGPKPGAGEKAIPAVKGMTFDFSTEKKMKELWELPESQNWQSVNRGLLLRGRGEFTSRFTWTGDCTMELAFVLDAGVDHCKIELYGEEIRIPWEAGGIVVQRKGEKLLIRMNKKESSIVLKDEEKDKPTKLKFVYVGNSTIKGIRITTKELHVDQAPLPLQ